MADEVKDIYAAKREAKTLLFNRPGVTGVGIGDNRIRVTLESEEARAGIPEQFGGFPVEFIVTGKIEAYG